VGGAGEEKMRKGGEVLGVGIAIALTVLFGSAPAHAQRGVAKFLETLAKSSRATAEAEKAAAALRMLRDPAGASKLIEQGLAASDRARNILSETRKPEREEWLKLEPHHLHLLTEAFKKYDEEERRNRELRCFFDRYRPEAQRNPDCK
jgi:hypothetical protein